MTGLPPFKGSAETGRSGYFTGMKLPAVFLVAQLRLSAGKFACGLCAGLICLYSSLAGAQTLVLDPIGVGAAVTVTGSGGPASASVELFKNGTSVGAYTTTAFGQFSIPNIGTSSNDQFYAIAGQVWNFNTAGNVEGWNALAGDASVVSNGTWKQTNSTGTDMSINLYGDGQIRTRARALEVRVRFQGSGSRTGSVIMQTAGTNGVVGGGDDASSTIANTFTLSPNTNFQTLVFDLGIDHNGAATCWLDGTAPININIYLPGCATNDSVEVDSVRLTEALRWEFETAGDFAEWSASANTTLLATNPGTLRMNASAVGSVAMSRPFRVIGSRYFVKMETRLRQVSTSNPNLIYWNYLSNPSGYANGGIQLLGTVANGSYQTITLNLTNPPTYGNNWTNGGGATLNSAQGYQTLYANSASEYAEVDYIRLLPAAPFGPSAVVTATGAPVIPAYYVSASGGNNSASGRSPATAWATFTNLDGLFLGAGTTVNLKRGDTWTNQMLRLTGKGLPGNPITLTAYGDGASPLITGRNLTNAPCIQWENPSYVRIEGMDCRNAKIGVYLRYTGGNTDGTGAMFRNTNVVVTCCNFQNMNTKWSAADGSVTVVSPFELSWGTGVWVGGNIPTPGAATNTPILDDLSVTHCGFKDVSQGLSMNFYFPPYSKSRFTNVKFEDSWVTGCEAGSFAFFFVNGGLVQRVDTWLGGTNFYATGTTAGFVQHSTNVSIFNCEFAGNKRVATEHDGVGFDYEGNTDKITFTNNVIHDNDGAGLLLLSSVAGNTGMAINDNTFWNNARSPLNSTENVELRGNVSSSGSFNNNGVYRGAANVIGTPGIYDNASLFAGYTGGSTTRTSVLYSAVSGRPTLWNFTSSVEGWGNSNQWSGFTASGGALVGTSTGGDPYAESAATWVNTRERRWVLVRMSQTAGTLAQVFFQTETDPTFTGDKTATFTIIPDGVMRDYIVDMSQSAKYRGVITKWRLDPTDTTGSTMAIDSFTAQTAPYLASVTAVSPRILDLRFNQPMLATGGVFNVANYILSGAGQGTASSQPSSVSLIPTTNGPVYRLTWNSGDMNGATAVLAATNAIEPRGVPLWTGSQSGFASIAPLAVAVSPTSTNGQCSGTVTFTANFTGTPTPTLQWYNNSTNAIANATNATLTVSSLTSAQNGNWTVVASNSSGFVTNFGTLTVVDTLAPVVTLLGGNPLTNQCHTAFTDPGATASDACAGSLGVTVFSTLNTNSPGSYLIRYVATDSSGNSATNTRTVVVVDTIAPSLTCSTNILIVTTNLGGENVSFTVTATDACDASPTVICTPASGSLFAPGTNTVNCIAYDASLNTNTCSFTVTVIPASVVAPTVAYGPIITNGQFVVRYLGYPGFNYTVEATAMLPAAWTKKSNHLAPTNNNLGFGIGVWEFSESVSPTNRFYRVAYPAY